MVIIIIVTASCPFGVVSRFFIVYRLVVGKGTSLLFGVKRGVWQIKKARVTKLSPKE